MLSCEEPVWDFGEVNSAASLHHAFELRNDSAETIHIADVDFDCGCMIAGQREGYIDPRQTFSLPLTISVDGRPGPFVKHVYVTIDAPRQETLVLQVQGVIRRNGSLYSTVDCVDFGRIAQGDTAVRSVIVGRYDGSPVRFIGIDAGDVAVTSTPADSSRSRPSLHQLAIPLRFDASDVPVSRVRGMITLLTDHQRFPSLRIGIRAEVVAPESGLRGSILVRLHPGDSTTLSLYPTRSDANKDLRTASALPGPELIATSLAGTDALSVELLQINAPSDHPLAAADGMIRIRCHEAVPSPQLVKAILHVAVEQLGNQHNAQIPVTALILGERPEKQIHKVPVTDEMAIH